jgi:glycosidase
MVDALKYWVTKFDVDGFRCDVASMVGTKTRPAYTFWEYARRELNSLRPVFMLAESEEANLQKFAFDMNYGGDLNRVMNDVAAGKKNVSHLYDALDKQRKDYPAYSIPMQFTSNHDENSWNGDVFERLGAKAAEALAVFTYLIPGMPLIYSGQEVGMNKRLKFFDKDLIPWRPHPFEILYQKLNQLKKKSVALTNSYGKGSFHPLQNSKPDQIMSFTRGEGKDKIVCLLNLSDSLVEFSLNYSDKNRSYGEYFSGKEHRFDQSLNMKLAPWEYRVYKLDEIFPPRSLLGTQHYQGF